MAFPYLKSFFNGSRFPEHQFTTNHIFEQACSIIKATCIFEEFKDFENSVTIFCKRASWMIPRGLEIATPGKWSTSRIVKNFTGANLCRLKSQNFFVLNQNFAGCGQPYSLYSVWTVNFALLDHMSKSLLLKLTHMLTACCAKDGKVSLSLDSHVCPEICFS